MVLPKPRIPIKVGRESNNRVTRFALSGCQRGSSGRGLHPVFAASRRTVVPSVRETAPAFGEERLQQLLATLNLDQ